MILDKHRFQLEVNKILKISDNEARDSKEKIGLILGVY
jgi:hypothetical protein